MAWTTYTEPLEILSAEDVNNIYENITIIREKLLQKNFDVEPTREVVAKNDTPYVEIFDILNNIEYNLNIINNNEAQSAYFGTSKTVGEYAPNKDEIWRWICILNDMLPIVNGEKGKWTLLRCKNGFPTISGDGLVARGDLIE